MKFKLPRLHSTVIVALILVFCLTINPAPAMQTKRKGNPQPLKIKPAQPRSGFSYFPERRSSAQVVYH